MVSLHFRQLICNGANIVLAGEHDKWLFVNSETKESGYTRPKPAPRPRLKHRKKSRNAAYSTSPVAEETVSPFLIPREDERPGNALVNTSAE